MQTVRAQAGDDRDRGAVLYRLHDRRIARQSNGMASGAAADHARVRKELERRMGAEARDASVFRIARSTIGFAEGEKLARHAVAERWPKLTAGLTADLHGPGNEWSVDMRERNEFAHLLIYAGREFTKGCKRRIQFSADAVSQAERLVGTLRNRHIEGADIGQ